jgi:flagellar biosynthesis protein
MMMPGKNSAKNPSRRQIAIALGYHADHDAVPKILAKGAGKIAARIIELAREHHIPIREDADLATALSQLELGEYIPAELYPAVAEVLAYIYRQNQQQKTAAAPKTTAP